MGSATLIAPSPPPPLLLLLLLPTPQVIAEFEKHNRPFNCAVCCCVLLCAAAATLGDSRVQEGQRPHQAWPQDHQGLGSSLRRDRKGATQHNTENAASGMSVLTMPIMIHGLDSCALPCGLSCVNVTALPLLLLPTCLCSMSQMSTSSCKVKSKTPRLFVSCPVRYYSSKSLLCPHCRTSLAFAACLRCLPAAAK
jgi:hypothetical protein